MVRLCKVTRSSAIAVIADRTACSRPSGGVV